MPNVNIASRRAQANKNDEFFTLLEDIESEILQYDISQFCGKTVYCNCDNPTVSNFFKFFAKWGRIMGIKQVHFTNYANQSQRILHTTDGVDNMQGRALDNIAHHWIYRVKDDVIVKSQLAGDGDFRSQECIDILKQCDIVVTNPPFSLLRQFVSTVMLYDKQILVIGAQNAISYKEIFALIQQNRLWLGNRHHLSGIITKDGAIVRAKQQSGALPRACCWFTNLQVRQRNRPLELCSQDISQYPRYDNYDAIEVSRTKQIPDNYYGKMGVPITFLQKYCPSQFEIIDGIGRYSVMHNHDGLRGKYLSMVNGVAKYFRIVIKRIV